MDTRFPVIADHPTNPGTGTGTGAGYSDFSTHTFKISSVATTAAPIHSSDTHSRTEWKFWPPAQTLGVSRPI